MALISPWWDFSLLFGIFVFTLYIWIVKSYSYWSKRGVQGPNPYFLVGNFGNVLMGREMMGEKFREIYKETKHLPVAGAYMMMEPMLVINDLELVKKVLVKDFAHFTDHNKPIDENVDPINAHLFNLTGEKWKNLRAKLSPTFTTNKIKGMFGVIAQCGIEMNKYLDETTAKNDIVDMKEILAKLNTDIIGSCAFGIECNSFKNTNVEFRKMGKKILDPDVVVALMTFMTNFIPKLKKYIKRSVHGPEVSEFFYNLVKQTIQYRENNNVVRNDFLQLLIQLKNDGVIDDENSESNEKVRDDGTRLTTMQVASQVFVFFIAGFETSSSTSSFAMYELALNPDIQNKAREEIDQVLEKYDNKVTYDGLGEMTYLTNLLEETLRKYPPLPLLFRICTKDYNIPGTDIVIEKDTGVIIPVLGIQKDEEYFPDPEKFDPDRFTPEMKSTRNQFTHLPFGEGPRVCIANRFGMLQTKLGLVSILSEYELSVCKETTIPMKFATRTIMMVAEKGVLLKLTKRVK